jgi:hypothetical protein
MIKVVGKIKHPLYHLSQGESNTNTHLTPGYLFILCPEGAGVDGYSVLRVWHCRCHLERDDMGAVTLGDTSLNADVAPENVRVS